jgi:(p)ppGpp synthase/HD superfamily hydrolase
MTAQDLLARWVRLKHSGQIKKYNGKPYYTHLYNVAKLARQATPFGYEIGLCHDLLEDTATTPNELLAGLLSFGYPPGDANYIANVVVELTDVFTSAAYPSLSREMRKEKEEFRLRTISACAQTIKYADLIDNMKLVIEYDPEHAPRYLEKKRLLLQSMNKGDEALREQALQIIHANQ